MKQYLLTTLFVAAIFITAHAQKLKSASVPQPVKQAFSNSYKGSTATWEKENGNYEANFTYNHQTMSAVIDNNGSILETEVEIPVSQLPRSIEGYVKTQFRGKVIKEASKITKANGNVEYEAVVDKRSLVFDSNGKFMKEEED